VARVPFELETQQLDLVEQACHRYRRDAEKHTGNSLREVALSSQ